MPGGAKLRQGAPPAPDIVLELSSRAWHELVLGLTGVLEAAGTGRATVRMGEVHLEEFARRLAKGIDSFDVPGRDGLVHENGASTKWPRLDPRPHDRPAPPDSPPRTPRR